MGTKVTIDGNITEVNDTPKYRLYGRCTARGSLPDESIFVLEIVDEDAPDEDVLYRVAQVPDIVDVTVGFDSDRDRAIRNGRTYWRSSQFTNYYDDVEVAANAKQVLQDEVNELVTAYVTYSDQFEATSEEVEFPSAATGAVQALKDAYDTAYSDYATALTTQETADETLTDAQSELSDIEDWLDRKAQLEADLTDRTAEMQNAKDRFSAFLGSGIASDAEWFITQVTNFIANYDSHLPLITDPNRAYLDSIRDGLEDDKNDFAAQRSQALTAFVNGSIAQGLQNHQNMEADAAPAATKYIKYTAADLTTAQNAVTAAQTAKVTADADVTAKYAAMEAAYDAAKAVCPDWTPDNPLPPEPAS